MAILKVWLDQMQDEIVAILLGAGVQPRKALEIVRELRQQAALQIGVAMIGDMVLKHPFSGL